MTRFLDVDAVGRLVRAIGIENFLSEVAGYITEDYAHWPEFEKSARLASLSPLGVIELMPTANATHYAFKYVNGHPGNAARNLPTVMAFGVLAEVATGLPVLLSEMTITTALRTAATSAVVARALARPDSRRMAVIGCGAQSEFQILAFKALLGIGEVVLFDINPAAVEKARRNLAAHAGMNLTVATSVREAVKGADIVTTLTAAKTRAAILTPDMIEPGMHLNAVGGDSPGKTELHPDIVHAARMVVEFEPQTRIEGELQQMPADFPVIGLWEVLNRIKPGRENAAQVTLFDSVGFAIEDFSALRYLNDMAIKHQIGADLNLIPALRDPKDLYATLKE